MNMLVTKEVCEKEEKTIALPYAVSLVAGAVLVLLMKVSII